MYIDVRFFFRFKIITPDPTHPDQLNFPSKSVHDLGNKYPVIKVNLSGGVYYIYSVYFCHRISKCVDVLFVHFVMHLILLLTSRSVRLATTQYKHTMQSLNGLFFYKEANYENTTTPCLVRSPRGYMYKIRRGARVPMSSNRSF